MKLYALYNFVYISPNRNKYSILKEVDRHIFQKLLPRSQNIVVSIYSTDFIEFLIKVTLVLKD
jgi:hypothetical protein